ncbi:Site-specific recombinase XerD [Capnocytophaga ochracea]|uniref:Site-specific recombinase XerD n=1 Tax=Capnocytophaga ochracea TaxID=1018 RepID=A0A2X2SLN8_CAPOC|nr:Site-specific recombinase XerD [Capnocytophaga ochracea]
MAKQLPKTTAIEHKNTAIDLNALRQFLEKCVNLSDQRGEVINTQWLKDKVDIHFKRITDTATKQSDLITELIDHIIQNASTRKNGRGTLGLSVSRVKSYHTLKNIFIDYQAYTRKRYKAKDINTPFEKMFLGWLMNKRGYKDSYALKIIDNLKAVCNEAQTLGMETSPQLTKVGKGTPDKETPVYLNALDLERVRSCVIENKSLDNARKWLLLGCLLGQRGGDLLDLTESNFVQHIDGGEYVELKQQKTGKIARIPIVGALQEIKTIRNNGLPYKISVQKLDKYIKQVCKLAGITELVEHSKVCMVDAEGNIIEQDDKGNYTSKGVKRTVKGVFEKWQLIGSHTCRRSFATNLYGKLETVFIMQMTGHTKESTFLAYIGKTAKDYLTQTAERLRELEAVNVPTLKPLRTKIG